MTSDFADDGDVALVQSPYESINQSRWLNVTYSLEKNSWDRHTSIKIQRVDKDDWITDLDAIEEGDGVRTVCLPIGDYRLAFRAVIGLSGPSILQTVSSLSNITSLEYCTYSGPDIRNTDGKCDQY